MADRARILVVDDKLVLAETIADGLVDRGYRASATGSSREALAAVERGAIDLLVTDLRMPDHDGLTLVRAARLADVDIPVIVMSADSAIDAALEAVRRGAFHFLVKPFKLAELAELVDRALSDRKQGRRA